MLNQLPHNTSHHLKQVGMICNLGEYVDWPQMYCNALSRSLDRHTVLLPNFLPAVGFQLFLNYIRPGVCLFLDHLAGLFVKEFLQELHLASLYPVRLFVG